MNFLIAYLNLVNLQRRLALQIAAFISSLRLAFKKIFYKNLMIKFEISYQSRYYLYTLDN